MYSLICLLHSIGCLGSLGYGHLYNIMRSSLGAVWRKKYKELVKHRSHYHLSLREIFHCCRVLALILVTHWTSRLYPWEQQPTRGTTHGWPHALTDLVEATND
jgi:hypothetical protein